MHCRPIDLCSLSDLLRRFHVSARHDDGPTLTTIGRHRVLGACVVVQNTMDGDVVLLSELPAQCALDYLDDHGSEG